MAIERSDENPWGRGDEMDKIEMKKLMPVLEVTRKAARKDLRDLLEEKRSFRETFRLNADGTLILEGSPRQEGLMTFAISSLTPPWRYSEPSMAVYTPEDLRMAAAEFCGENPDVEVTFPDDGTRKAFSYAFSLPEKPKE